MRAVRVGASAPGDCGPAVGLLRTGARVLPACALAAVAAACASREAVRLSPDFGRRAPARVAVLPFENHSTDLAGAEMLRGMVRGRLARWGYGAMDIEAVDEALRGLGYTDGGQLGAAEPAELAEALGVDGLMYGELLDFKDQNVGFYRKRRVELRLRLVDPSSGETLWEDLRAESRSNVALSSEEAKKNFLRGVGARAVEKLVRRPLREESERVVNKLFSRLPRRP